ncbi:MAG TPA: hypothetical protein PKZ63_03990, partial [Candidatus Saccharicenans sp.]|nr:hypothetical protein [Candidatus Saccharicenans sp.]
MSAQWRSENLKKENSACSARAKRIIASSSFFLVLFLFFASLTLLAGQEVQKQLIVNSSFEELKDGKPLGWRPRTYQPQAVFEVDSPGRSGERSVKISSTGGAD